MKNKGWIIFWITLLSILVVALVIGLIFLLDGKKNFFGLHFDFGYRVSQNLIMDEMYETDFNTISIDTSAADISISETQDSYVRVVVYGDKERLHMEDRNQTLTIDYQEKKCKGLCLKRTIGKVEVYVPSNYSQDIIVHNQYGDVSIGEFREANLEIIENCGEVKIDGAKKIAVTNDYGDIELGNAEIATIKQSCGDIYVDTVKEMDAENKFGDIEIRRVLGYLNIEEDCGDIHIDHVNLERSSTIKNNLGDIEIGSTNEIYIDAKTSLGDVDIRNNYRKSEVILTIKNDCGDIEVDN